MPLCWTHSAFLVGLHPQLITVEVSAQPGIPGLQIVGLPSRAVSEARQRISASLQNSGFRLKAWKTVVNLAPAHLPKTGSGFDLAIAASLLFLQGYLKTNLNNSLMIGELALDGSIHNVPGILAMALKAKQFGINQIICPYSVVDELSSLKGIKIWPVQKLRDLCAGQKTQLVGQNMAVRFGLTSLVNPSACTHQFNQIVGQEKAKRALVVAATGGHHLLMIGPPGCGKTLLAQALPFLLPPLSKSELSQVAQIYSIFGTNRDFQNSIRPFRMPHHTISLVRLMGGGSQSLPGELSLAHRGVVFLDELCEFGPIQLEALRQPLETGKVELVRGKNLQILPAECLIVAAANPCHCGWKDSQTKICQCSEYQLIKYANKLSGPLLDRFDLIVKMSLPTQTEMELATKPTSAPPWFELAHAEVKKAGQNQLILANQLCLADISEIKTELAARKILLMAQAKHQYSTRVYHKILKVAATISKLANDSLVRAEHMTEAIQLRANF